jgi:hypothetical protein
MRFKAAGATGTVAVLALLAGLLVNSAIGIASTSLPGGELHVIDGVLTDKRTGNVYNFQLHATEDGDEAGVGSMWFELGGAPVDRPARRR